MSSLARPLQLLFIGFGIAIALSASPSIGIAADPIGEPSTSTPPASKLLPADTLAYLRIRNVTDVRGNFQTSTLGKMLDDPAMRPFVSDTFQTFSQWFDQSIEQVDLPLKALLDIPTGQFAVALIQAVPPTEEDQSDESKKTDSELTDEQIRQRMQRRQRQQNGFAGVVMIETGIDTDAEQTMRDLLAQVSVLAEQNKSVKTSETIGEHSLTRWVRSRGRSSVIEWFDRDGMFVVGIGNETAAEVLRRWNAIDAPKNRKDAANRKQASERDAPTSDEAITMGTLSGSFDFASVMTRCMGAEAETPQITFFVNPYAIAQRFIRRSGSAFFIQPIVEDLGIAKIRGIGGSVFRGGDLVENVIHVHALIDPPRDGFFGVVRPDDVDPQPPNWIPAEAGSYLTLQWDIATAFDNLTKIVERFAGEGAFDRFAEDQFKERLGVSLRDDLIENLTGRYVRFRRYQSPATWNSDARVDALQIIDVDKAKTMLDTIEKTLPSGEITSESVLGYTVFFLKDRSRFNSQMLRDPVRSIMLLDDYLLMADSREILEVLLRSHKGEIDRLSDDSDFALLASEMGVKLETENPFLLSFTRDSSSFRVLYEMAASPNSTAALARSSENNPAMQRFGELLGRQRLPAFENFEKYFNVSGAYAYSEPGGLHVGLLNLRPLD